MKPQRKVERFTPKSIAALKPEAARYTAWGQDGFGVRVTPTGCKTFVFSYARAGHTRWMTLGRVGRMTLAEANATHRDALTAVEHGEDPAREAVQERIALKEAPTVAEFAEHFLKHYCKVHKRQWAEDARQLQHDVVPALGHLKLRDLKRREILALLARIGERGAPIAANRCLALVRRMCNYAVEQDVLESSPCANVKRPFPEQRRERWLTEREAVAFWTALDAARMTAQMRCALRFMLVTGQRAGEVLGARWQEFDFEAGVWDLSAQRTKSKRAHRLPLSSQALRLLREARLLSAQSKYLFPSRVGDRPMSVSAVGWALRENEAVFKSAGIAEPFRPHDLRRTCATHCSALGAPRIVVAHILNHSDQSTTGIYDVHSYQREMAEALGRWSERLERLIAGGRSWSAREGSTGS